MSVQNTLDADKSHTLIAGLCEDVRMFVTCTHENCLTDVDETLAVVRMVSRIYIIPESLVVAP